MRSVANRSIDSDVLSAKAWGINRDLAKRCVDSVGKIVSMFVALHNKYTQLLLHSEA